MSDYLTCLWAVRWLFVAAFVLFVLVTILERLMTDEQ